ncbi:MAG: type II toxin-antitoxin system VapC family toxin [Candidatus Acidiferrum sp.]
MIIDSSALVAIMYLEDQADSFARAIQAAETCRISAATFVETSIVVEKGSGDSGIRQLDAFLRDAGIVIEPFTVEQAYDARQAYSDYGKGRHPAGLNLGDCFSYALAKVADEPLLFKGSDFRKTDVKVAI